MDSSASLQRIGKFVPAVVGQRFGGAVPRKVDGRRSAGHESADRVTETGRPVYFPGNGATEPLTNYSGERISRSAAGLPELLHADRLPLYVEIGGNVNTTVGPVHTLTGNGVALANCVIDSSNTSVGSYLYSRGSVVMVPERPFRPASRTWSP